MNGNLRSLAWWVAPALAFFALLGIETDWGGEMHRAPAAPQAIEPKPVAPALLPEYRVEGGVAGLNETVERTLFNPTRRPAPQASAGAEGDRKVQSGQFVLTGTTLAGDRSIAFLKEVASGKARTVRKGDKVNGVLVAEVLPDRVRLTQGDDSEELLLKVAPGPKTTIAAAPATAGTHAPAARPNSLAGRRAAAAAAARGPAAGEPPGSVAPPATGRGARAAARAAAAAEAASGTTSNAPPPAGNSPTDAWGQVYQRMQHGAGRKR
ncbi:MAG TPA: hypothetical protein VGK37_15305 [Casimicrobiaceae bacterium]|jgi:hypothetical protein